MASKDKNQDHPVFKNVVASKRTYAYALLQGNLYGMLKKAIQPVWHQLRLDLSKAKMVLVSVFLILTFSLKILSLFHGRLYVWGRESLNMKDAQKLKSRK